MPAFSATSKCPDLLQQTGIRPVRIPLRSPNCNAHLERFHLSFKTEVADRMIFFGEGHLQQSIDQFLEYYHHERNHQGKGNVLLLPPVHQDTERAGPMRCRERLGGLLKYYTREAA